MPRYEDDYDELPASRRRENLMDRRLRRSRGEEIDEDDYDRRDDFDDYDDYNAAPRRYRQPAAAGGGCAQATLYLMLGGIAIALIVAFALIRTGNTIGNFFGGIGKTVPNISALVATPTTTIRANTAAVVRQVQQLNRLETTSFTIEKVIEAGNEGSFFYNMLYKDQLLLIAHGTVVAGIDLSKVSENDVSLSSDGETLTVRLPAVEIFSSALDNSKTRVYRRDQAPLAGDKDLETQARQAAESEILKAACEDGIMTRASTDGKQAVEQLFKLADFKHVIVVAPATGQCVPSAAPGAPVTTPTS